MQNPSSYIHSNVAGFVNLLDACEPANRQPAIVWASSVRSSSRFCFLIRDASLIHGSTTSSSASSSPPSSADLHRPLISKSGLWRRDGRGQAGWRRWWRQGAGPRRRQQGGHQEARNHRRWGWAWSFKLGILVG